MHYIFLITGNDLDGKLVDQVFEAGKVVKSAHVKAGRILSSKLRKKIVEELEAYEDIDPFNIWEPIEMTIEGIGPVKILKIIEIGSPINVDVSYTNRLLEEE